MDKVYHRIKGKTEHLKIVYNKTLKIYNKWKRGGAQIFGLQSLLLEQKRRKRNVSPTDLWTSNDLPVYPYQVYSPSM